MRTTLIHCDSCGDEIEPGPANVYNVDVTHAGAQERYDLCHDCAGTCDLADVHAKRLEARAKPPTPGDPPMGR